MGISQFSRCGSVLIRKKNSALGEKKALVNRWATRISYLDSSKRTRKLRQAPATSSAFRMADTTQMRRAPAANTSFVFTKLIPPIANQGMLTLAAAQRTYSSVTGLAVGLVSVA